MPFVHFIVAFVRLAASRLRLMSRCRLGSDQLTDLSRLIML